VSTAGFYYSGFVTPERAEPSLRGILRCTPATLTTGLIRGRRALSAGKPSWRAGDLYEVAE